MVAPHFIGDLVVRNIDGHHWCLVEPVAFYSERYRGVFTVHPGFITDFSSVPRGLWNLIPQRGKHDRAGVLHDAAYQGRLRTVQGLRQHCSREVADHLFLEGLAACGVSRVVRQLMYRAVRINGGAAYAKGQARAQVARPVG